ncbi:Transglutaminase-like superfamily protein [compost metagenome]
MHTGVKFIFKVVIPLLMCSFFLTGCFWIDMLAEYRQNLVNAQLEERARENTSASKIEDSTADSTDDSTSETSEEKLTIADIKKKYDPDITDSNKKDMQPVPDPVILEEVPLNADSALEEYLARFLIHGQKRISLQAFSEAQNAEGLYDTLQKVMYQNPLIIGLNTYWYNSLTKTLVITYQDSQSTMTGKQQKTVTEARLIIDSIIQEEMTDEEKRQAIYDYLEQNATYDDEAYDNSVLHNYKYVDSEYDDAFSTYGVIVEKLGVCMSYAYSYKMLADIAGIESIIVTGTLDDVPHAWNKVKIGDEWLNIDSTNGANNSGVPYFLYNSSDEMATNLGYIEDEDYWLDEELYQFTGSTSKYDYYVVHDLEVKSLSEYKAKLSKGLQSGASTVSLRLLADMDEDEMLDVISEVYNEVAPELLEIGEYYEIENYVVFHQ